MESNSISNSISNSVSNSMKHFATANKLQAPKLDDDGTLVLFGRTGQIFEYSDTLLGVIYSNRRDKTSQRWNTHRTAAISVGMELHQHGDTEGSLTFNPKDKAQVKVSIKAAGVKAKKNISDEQRAAGAARLAQWRSAQTQDIASA
jgi:hypothetical protein